MALGSVTFAGLGSGLPPDIVDQLMVAQEARMTRMEHEKNYYTGQKGAFETLNSKLSSLKGLAEELRTTTAFTPHTTSSSDTDEITATASSTAIAANHTINVTQLAKHSTVAVNSALNGGTEVTDSTDTLTAAGAHEFDFTYNGTAYGTDAGTTGFTSADLQGMTLSDLAGAINGIDYGTDSTEGVTASVLYDGDSYRLVMMAKDSGMNGGAERIDAAGLNTAGEVSLTFDSGAVIASSNTDFVQSTAAQDAAFTIDGISVTSTNNQVTEVLDGVTLSLLDATSTDLTVTISDDTDALKTSLNNFLGAYNDIVDFIKSESGKDGYFRSESMARSVISQMRSVFSTATTDTDGTDLTYGTLATLGIETTSSGHLSVDSTKFAEALAADYTAVQSIFTTDTDGAGTDGIAYRLTDLLAEMTDTSDGLVDSRADGIGDRIDRIDDRMLREQDRLDMMRERLTKRFASLESLMNSMNGSGNAIMSTLNSL